jgi:putative transposase
MRNRDYKIFAPDNYYHVFNRGNAKMDIFLDQEDYKFFLWRLKENIFPEKSRRAPSATSGMPNVTKERYVRKLLPPNSFSLTCYCLMPNHFHLLIKQNSKIKISELILRICGSYAKYFNKKYNRVGSLFQDQYKAILIDKNNYILWLSTYIHKNPQMKNLVNNPADWEWSSYLDYIGQKQESICDKGIVLEQLNPSSYKSLVNQDFNKDKSMGLNTFLLDLE